MIRSRSILLTLALAGCVGGSGATPLPGDVKVRIGSPPVLLLGHAQPAPSGNAARQRHLLRLFIEAGCGNAQTRWRSASELPHVVCTLRGQVEETIFVSANFNEPFGNAAADNWVGAAMLPSLYRSLRVEPRRHTYVFVGYADEARGHMGSPSAFAHMVRRLPDAERDPLVALVTLQGLPLGTASVWETEADPNLYLDLYSVSRSLQLPMRPIDFYMPGGDPLLLRPPVRLPPLDIPSIVIGVSRLQLGEYLDSFRLVSVYLSYLDQTLVMRRQILRDRDAAAAPGADSG